MPMQNDDDDGVVAREERFVSQGDTERTWCDEDYLSLNVKPSAAVDPDQCVDVDVDGEEDVDDDLDDAEQAKVNSDWNPTLPPPWLIRGYNHQEKPMHPLTFLHNEIVSFVHLMEPLPSEIKQRENLVRRVQKTVAQHFAIGTQLVVFGSQATGLFLPTSDIDLVVLTTTTTRKSDDSIHGNSQQDTAKNDPYVENDHDSATIPKSPLHQFMQAMHQREWLDDLSYLEAVENTRIPLVKFTMANTFTTSTSTSTSTSSPICVDVSFNQPTGPPAADLMKRYLEALPPLRPLTIVLKYFLAARALNEPYTGGVGSFMLQLMIVAFLQQRERDAVNFQRPSAYNLGALLLEFLELYGLEFNYYTTGISVRFDGSYFPKGAADRRANFIKPDRSLAMLALENPLDPTLDVGQSSFRYQTVQRAFAVAYRMLLSHVTAEPHELSHVTTLLATILPPTPYMTSRMVLARRDRPLAAKRQQSASPPLHSHGADRARKRERRRY